MPFTTRKPREKNNMIKMYDIERKIPCKVVESLIDNKIHQFVVDADSDLDRCINAASEIKDYLIQMKKDAQEKAENQEQPPEA